jgi:D-aspartate ligase
VDIKDISTAVLVLKAEQYSGLGIIRSLGHHGIPVYAVDSSRQSPAFVSRYCAGRFFCDSQLVTNESALEYLSAVRTKIGRPTILIPTSDEMALFIAKHSAVLKDKFLFPKTSSALISALCSKKKMHHLANRFGVPTPAAFFPDSKAQLLTILGELRYPLTLKGIDGSKLEKRTGKKMVLVWNEDELLKAYDAMEEVNNPNLIIQEYISGNEDSSWIFNGYFNSHSENCVAFTGKKIRQNPVYMGMTSLGICMQNNHISNVACRFLKDLQYEGIVDIDFRFDVRDGKYKILDVNPRVGATFRLFVDRNGVDIIQAMYCDLTNQPVPIISYDDGRKWIVEDKDILSSYHYFRDRRLGIVSWLRSIRGVNEGGYFDPHDQYPFWRMIMNHCKKTGIKLFKRAVRSPKSSSQIHRAIRLAPGFRGSKKKFTTIPRFLKRHSDYEFRIGTSR